MTGKYTPVRRAKYKLLKKMLHTFTPAEIAAQLNTPLGASLMQPGTRAKYRGDHLVPIKVDDLVQALSDEAKRRDISEQQLCRDFGITATTLSTLRSGKYHSMFSINLTKIEQGLGVPAGTFTRKRRVRTFAPSTPSHVNGTAPDAISLTMDYFSAVRKLPIDDQARAQRLLKLLLES